MIYLVTAQKSLFDNPLFKEISVKESIKMIKSWNKVIQFDTETAGVDARISNTLCAQFGNKKAGTEIVVDTTTVDLSQYKEVLEESLIVGQNLYFDLQFLYNYGIICRNVYDTMIVEQLLYLGFPYIPVTPETYDNEGYDFPYKIKIDKKTGRTMYELSFSLQAIAKKRLNLNIDKSIRGQIIWRGLDSEVIVYAANDVKWLEDIMWSQVADCKKKNCLKAAKVECDFIPVLAYGSWCGIGLDEKAWRKKMQEDEDKLTTAINDLNKFVIAQNNPKFITRNLQGDLFTGFDTEPKCSFEWGRPGVKAKKGPIKEFIKSLGFDTSSIDEATGDEKDSIDLKALKKQKGINDKFLEIYVAYSEALKVVTTYGITYINAINPYTKRIHTQFKQLAADTGRISCGNGEESDSIKINPDLAKLKGFPLKTNNVELKCGYPNIQTLPSDKETRACFTPKEGNVFCSCDWSAIESRLGADIYEEKAMIDEFLYGSGDMHSLVAKMVFEELADVPVKDIKKLYPKLRSAAKPIEFSQQFGGSAEAIRNSMGCTIEEAQKFADAYNEGFKGIAKFKAKGSKLVRQNGYIELNPITGHKTYWWDHQHWINRQKSFTSEFWENYRNYHKGTNDAVAQEVKKHFKAASKWDRKALNSVTQGTGAICFKVAARRFFNWIIDNNYFNVVLITNFVHDELCEEHPKELEDNIKVSKILETIMQETAAIYCKSLPIPAEASVGTYWIH